MRERTMNRPSVKEKSEMFKEEEIDRARERRRTKRIGGLDERPRVDHR